MNPTPPKRPSVDAADLIEATDHLSPEFLDAIAAEMAKPRGVPRSTAARRAAEYFLSSGWTPKLVRLAVIPAYLNLTTKREVIAAAVEVAIRDWEARCPFDDPPTGQPTTPSFAEDIARLAAQTPKAKGAAPKCWTAIVDLARRARRTENLTIGCRWLAEEASCSRTTAGVILSRLQSDGWLRLDQYGKGTREASTYTLIGEGVVARTHKDSLVPSGSASLREPLTTVRVVSPSALISVLQPDHDAWQQGALAPTFITAKALDQAGGSSTPTRLASVVPRSIRTIHKHLGLLEDAGLVRNDKGTYTLTLDRGALDGYAIDRGVAGRGERAKARHRDEQGMWQEYLDLSEDRKEAGRIDRVAHHRTPPPDEALNVDEVTGEILAAPEDVVRRWADEDELHALRDDWSVPEVASGLTGELDVAA